MAAMMELDCSGGRVDVKRVKGIVHPELFPLTCATRVSKRGDQDVGYAFFPALGEMVELHDLKMSIYCFGNYCIVYSPDRKLSSYVVRPVVFARVCSTCKVA